MEEAAETSCIWIEDARQLSRWYHDEHNVAFLREKSANHELAASLYN